MLSHRELKSEITMYSLQQRKPLLGTMTSSLGLIVPSSVSINPLSVRAVMYYSYFDIFPA